MVSWKIIASSTAGGTTLIGLFAYIFLLTNVSSSFTGDSVCDQLECPAYINVNTTTYNICFDHPEDSQRIYYPDWNSGGKLARTTIGETNATVYKKSRFERVIWVNLNNVDMVISTEPKIPVDWYVPTIKRYADHQDDEGYWRKIKDGDCWTRNKKPNRNKLIGRATEGQVIKWNFKIGEEVDIDPIWISWDYMRKNESIQEPIYRITTEQIEIPCDKNNESCTNSIYYNKTTKALRGYKTIYYQKENPGILERDGIKVGNKEVKGWASVCGNILVERLVNPGDHNEEEFCRCRPDTIWKGVCKETNLLQ